MRIFKNLSRLSNAMLMTRNNNKYGIMKGLAIMGVVAGHSCFNTSLEVFVNYWHLPVFFFVSGYFLKQKHLDNLKGYIISRFQRLIVPFVIFAIIALVLHNILQHSGVISGTRYGMIEYLQEAKHLLFLSSNEQLIGAMWFLPALFIISIFGGLYVKYATGWYSALWGGGGNCDFNIL